MFTIRIVPPQLVSKALVPAAILGLAALLAGCAGGGAPETAAATPTALVPEPASATPLAAEVSLEASSPDACLTCHADRQRLIDTARPEEPEASESSGVG